MGKISIIGLGGMSVFMRVEHFHRPGETLVADNCFTEPGGKGYNQAVAAARMGAEVSFLSAIGDDAYGLKCVETLEKEGVNPFLMKKQGRSTTCAFILTDKTGENRVTVCREAELEPADVLAFESEIADSSFLVLQNEVPEPVNESAVKLAVAHGVKIIWNPAPARQFNADFSKSIFLVTPNEHESHFLNLNDFQNSIVTLGAAGCLVNNTDTIRPPTVTPLDTTGAGDTFNGVLAALLAEGNTLLHSADIATRAASFSTTRLHVLESIPYRSELC